MPKITEFTALTAASSDDIFPVVDDPQGTALTKKITLANLKTSLVLVKGDVGLGNVDNTADSAKPVSTAQQTALDEKSSTSHNHTGVYEPTKGVDDNFVTDAEKTKLANLSGTNTGDQTTISGNAGTATALSAGTDRTKLDGIAAGAEVNVNADWSSGSGDSQILNKPTIPKMAFNASVAAQGAGFATDTYLVGSSIAIPASSLQAKTMYRCVFNVVKTAAGIAAPIIRVRFGVNGSTADTALATLTFSAQTAVIDEGTYELRAIFRTVGSGTSAVLQTHARLHHRLSITGLGVGVSEPEIATSAGFDSTVANSIIGLSVNGGTSAAWTVNVVQAELVNLI
jgi:hypothetical protein